jgi:hypothetical protein
MSKILKDLRPAYVIGIGWHRYQSASETSYVQLALTAMRQQSNARVGLAHRVGLGSVCYAHVLSRDV